MNVVRKLFPAFFPAYHIISGYLYDMKRFITTNTNNNHIGNRKKHDAILIRSYHGIEKAFSLPNIRKGFGKTSCIKLIQEVSSYYSNYGYNNLIKASIDVLIRYKEYHYGYKTEELNYICGSIDILIKQIREYDDKSSKFGGTLEVFKSDIEALNNRFNFKEFCYSRSSVRDFALTPKISNDIIIEAVEMALKTPSVCNRQAWKVHLYKGLDAKKILQYQNGNRGFRENIDTVLLITGLTTSFSNKERNQVFIDGGLFSMTLMYALHSMSVGVCALNTSYNVKEEKLLHKDMNISDEEVPIMMLAVGHLKESFLVAKSYRKSSNEILEIHTTHT